MNEREVFDDGPSLEEAKRLNAQLAERRAWSRAYDAADAETRIRMLVEFHVARLARNSAPVSVPATVAAAVDLYAERHGVTRDAKTEAA